MTIDPDDYDLRELRRIADERRDGRRSSDADWSGNGRRRRTEPRRRERQSDDVQRNGTEQSRNGAEPHRNGRSAEQSKNGHRQRESPDDSDADEVTVRPRTEDRQSRRADRAEDRDTRPQTQDSDTVVHADRIARDLGFGETGDGSHRNGRADRQRGQRQRRDAVGHPRAGYDDDIGRFQFDTDVRERPRSRPGEVLRQTQLEHLLVHETAASDGLSKPYLTTLPDAYAAERLLFDWLEFLVLKGGFKRTMDALRYYHTVGWLTTEVEADLRDYLVGFSGEVSDTEAYDIDDHHLSLVYIARLASMT